MWRRERLDLQAKISEIMNGVERIKVDCREEISTYKNKYADYKKKLKMANSKI
jgi:hypothetical protein